MSVVHVGCAGFSVPRRKYLSKLSFVEIELRTPAPNAKVLTAWREQTGAGFGWSVVAPRSLWGEADWPLRDERYTQSEFDKLAHVCSVLQPQALVLRTPRALSPGSVACRRFLALLPRLRALVPVVAWEPTGLWERTDARVLVAAEGVVVVCDPLHDDLVDEASAYVRLRGLGGDRRYHRGKLEDLATVLGAVEQGFVVFDTDNGFSEAVQLRALLAGQEPAADDESDDDAESELDEYDRDDDDEDDDDDSR